jgi:hypothetical protein
VRIERSVVRNNSIRLKTGQIGRSLVCGSAVCMQR